MKFKKKETGSIEFSDCPVIRNQTQGPKVQESKSLYLRDNPVALRPPARIRHRTGIHAPAAVGDVPVSTHGPRLPIFAFFAFKIEDEPLRALAVRIKKGAKLGNRNLGFLPQLGEDGSIKRRFFEPADDELGRFGRENFQTQELGLEIISHRLHSGLREVLLGSDNSRLGRDADSANESKN